jgi:hypothetical protein
MGLMILRKAEKEKTFPDGAGFIPQNYDKEE